MRNRFDTWRGVALVLSLGLLLGCGAPATPGSPASGRATAAPTSAERPTATAKEAPTPPPGIARLAYPWPMHQGQYYLPPWNWLPDESVVGRITTEQAADVDAFLRWIGYEKPSVLQGFAPNPAELPIYVTADETPTVQDYLTQVQATGQFIVYLNTQFRLGPPNCTQDGLECRATLVLGPTVKVVYRTQTGQPISQDPPAAGVVGLILNYKEEQQRWQIAAFTIHLVPTQQG